MHTTFRKSQNRTLPLRHLVNNQQQVMNKYTTYILNLALNFGVTTSRTITTSKK
jgi:hypothetical protein